MKKVKLMMMTLMMCLMTSVVFGQWTDEFTVENGVVSSAGEIVVYNVAGQVVATAYKNFEVKSLDSLYADVYFITAQEGTIKFVK